MLAVPSPCSSATSGEAYRPARIWLSPTPTPNESQTAMTGIHWPDVSWMTCRLPSERGPGLPLPVLVCCRQSSRPSRTAAVRQRRTPHCAPCCTHRLVPTDLVECLVVDVVCIRLCLAVAAARLHCASECRARPPSKRSSNANRGRVVGRSRGLGRHCCSDGRAEQALGAIRAREPCTPCTSRRPSRESTVEERMTKHHPRSLFLASKTFFCCTSLASVAVVPSQHCPSRST